VSLDCLDVHRFEHDLASAAEHLERMTSRQDAERARRSLRAALHLWRGEALQDVAYQSFAVNDSTIYGFRRFNSTSL